MRAPRARAGGNPRRAADARASVCYSFAMKTIGIDFGTKRLGVAASDPDGRVAFAVVDGTKSLRAQFADIFERHSPKAIVVGNPLSLSGESGPMSDKAAKFAVKMQGWFGVPVLLWDERMTSVQAQQGLPPGAKKGERDVASAVLILQSWLDARRAESEMDDDPV